MDRGRSKGPDGPAAAQPRARTGERISSSNRASRGSKGRSPQAAGRRDASIEDILIARAIPELADRHDPENPGRRLSPGSAGKWSKPIPTFVDALLDEGSERWQALAEAALAECRDPQIVAATLFQPAARVIGDKWRADETDFLTVTIAVTRMQRMFRRMTHEHPPTVEPSPARRVLLAPTPGDQHAFGLTVVEDAFRRAGWDVDCCACDEGADLFRLAGANEYLIIGLSVNIGRLLPDLASLVAALRARSVNRSVVLMGGGSLFVDHPGWAARAGFDLAASDAMSAVDLAEAAIASRASQHYLSMAAE